jgi:predicted small integral membrane protein
MDSHDVWQWAAYAAIALLLLAALLLWVIARKRRPFMAGDVFRASTWTRGNRLFPTQVAVTPTSVIQHTPRWIGKQDESIHIAHVASVKIDTHLFFSDVVIETSGGSEPVVCHGHWKSDAIRIKELIERYQTEQFRPAR